MNVSQIVLQHSPLNFATANSAETQRNFFGNSLLHPKHHDLTWDNPGALTADSFCDSFTSTQDAIKVTDCEDALPPLQRATNLLQRPRSTPLTLQGVPPASIKAQGARGASNLSRRIGEERRG